MSTRFTALISSLAVEIMGTLKKNLKVLRVNDVFTYTQCVSRNVDSKKKPPEDYTARILIVYIIKLFIGIPVECLSFVEMTHQITYKTIEFSENKSSLVSRKTKYCSAPLRTAVRKYCNNRAIRFSHRIINGSGETDWIIPVKRHATILNVHSTRNDVSYGRKIKNQFLRRGPHPVWVSRAGE